MLWQKAWIDTRWRFLIALALAVFWVWMLVQAYTQMAIGQRQMVHILAGARDASMRAQAATMAADINLRHWVDIYWSARPTTAPWVLFAALLGAGGIVSQSEGRGALFLLSLPVSRDRILFTRIAVGLAELAALAVIPALGFVVFAPSVGQIYPIAEAVSHGLEMFVEGLLAFGLATWLSTVFTDLWRPVLIALTTLVLAEGLMWHPEARHAVLGLIWQVPIYRGPPNWGLQIGGALGGTALLVLARQTLMRRDF
jgi:hypothetical protein